MSGERSIAAIAAKVTARPREFIKSNVERVKQARTKQVEKLHNQGKRTLAERLLQRGQRAQQRHEPPVSEFRMLAAGAPEVRVVPVTTAEAVALEKQSEQKAVEAITTIPEGFGKMIDKRVDPVVQRKEIEEQSVAGVKVSTDGAGLGRTQQQIDSSFIANGPNIAVESMLSGSADRERSLNDLFASQDPRVLEKLSALGLQPGATQADIDGALAKWSDAQIANEEAHEASALLPTATSSETEGQSQTAEEVPAASTAERQAEIDRLRSDSSYQALQRQLSELRLDTATFEDQARRELSVEIGRLGQPIPISRPDDIVNLTARKMADAENKLRLDWVRSGMAIAGRDSYISALAQPDVDPAMGAALQQFQKEQASVQDSAVDAAQGTTGQKDPSEKTLETVTVDDLDALLKQINVDLPSERQIPIPKEMLKAATEFAQYGLGGEQQVRTLVGRALRLAKVSAELFVLQEQQAVWDIVQEKSPEQIAEEIKTQTEALGKASDEDKPKLQEQLGHLKQAQEFSQRDDIKKMPKEEKLANKVKIDEKVGATRERYTNIQKKFNEALEAIPESKQRGEFFKALQELPSTLVKDPTLGDRLVQLYQEGKKKKISGLLLAIITLGGMFVLQEGQQIFQLPQQ